MNGPWPKRADALPLGAGLGQNHPMARPGVLVTTKIPDSVLAFLREHAEVDYRDGVAALPRHEFLAGLAGKQAAMCVSANRLDGEAFDAGLPTLTIAANIAVGYDNIDVPAARARGVVVTNTPDVLTDACADLAMAILLAVARRVVEGDRLVRGGRWNAWGLDFMLGAELRGRQLGVIGYGRIGQAVAARAKAFGMHIACASSPGRQPAAAGEHGAVAMPFDDLLRTSDIVTVHVPLTPGTTKLIGAREFSLMKPSAYFVNTSRGAVVDEAALIAALKAGQIAGAALDVYEREPLRESELFAMDNVVVAPHLGSATVDTRTAMAMLAARNVVEVLAGRPPLTPIA